MGEIVVFPKENEEKIGFPYAKKMNLDSYITHCTKINSKWAINLTLPAKIINS